MDNNTTPLVSIVSLTFNHAPYIRECLDGFVMQKTDFPFEIIIHDDASTDDTADIIREYAEKYPHLFRPILQKENQYSRHRNFNIILKECIEKAKGKYIAFCEGDDFWNDLLKLQKQADYLELHPDVGMVYSDFNVINQTTGKRISSVFTNYPDRYPKTYDSAEAFVLKKGYVAPPSWLFRKELDITQTPQSSDGTFVYFTYFLTHTKTHVFDEPMVTYRKLEESASHIIDRSKIISRHENLYETQLKLIQLYNLDKSIIDNCTTRFYKSILNNAILANRQDIVKKAKLYLKNKSTKDNVLFLINDISPKILTFINKIRSHLIHIGILKGIPT